MTEQKTTARSYTLYPEQESIIGQAARDTGLGTASAALRFIVSDWHRLTQRNGGKRGGSKSTIAQNSSENPSDCNEASNG